MAPDTFLVLELYRDRDAVDAHGKSAHVAEALPRVGPMLDGDVEVEILEQVW
jgi:quinol monooxygenase YgiN